MNNEETKYEFSFEKLLCNGEIVFERKNEKIFVAGYDKVPQPKRDESLILQYSEDENFERLISGIRKLYSVETELAVRGGIRSESFSLKLHIAKNYYYELYIKIFEAVKELFIEIEDIDVEENKPCSSGLSVISHVPPFLHKKRRMVYNLLFHTPLRYFIDFPITPTA